MAQVMNSPRFKLDSESDEEIEIDIGAQENATSERPDEQHSERMTAPFLTSNRRSKRVRLGILAISIIVLVGVSIGLVARFSRETHGPKRVNTSDGFDISFGSLETIGGEEVQNGDVVPFLDVQFSPDDVALFVLSKECWNASFIVYPTVVKRAAPVVDGLERGGILLETNDFAFHFELSSNKRYLELVQEFHYASLHGNSADELQQMFDDSQWPGHVIKIPIYAETDSAYYLPTDVFLANGFFVSAYLSSSDFTALEEPSESFARNTMLFVEYELSTGVVEVNFAIGLLPEEVMRQRVADDRVGYFAKRYTEYSTTDQGLSDENGRYRWDPQITVIHRRNLELDSTTNTTKNPLTYYIDPSVPKEWREAFRDGVEAWAPAFERIGFSKAIHAVLPGESDWPRDYRLGDLRYNSISVMISEETYALGPTVIDPRSGEILHSDIVLEYGFINEVMATFDVQSLVEPPQLRRNTASNDMHTLEPSKSRTTNLRGRIGRSQQCGFAHKEQHQLDRMMLSTMAGDTGGYVSKRLIAQHFALIVMHEVGHTLGLRHNFAGSCAYSRDQLRDPAFVAKHGTSASVMDYLPANIFSDLKQHEVENHGFFMTTIGTYDYAAIAYGYATVNDEVPGYKHPRLSELAAAVPLFLSDEAAESMLNPYAQLFDLSSDLVDYAADRLKFVENARSTNAILKKVPEDASWTTLWKRERVLLRIVEQAITIVQPLLGGVNITHAHRDKTQESYNASFVPKDAQLEALQVLLYVIQAKRGLFPEPKDYGSYMEVIGFDGENCNEAMLDYSCLGRGLVDVGAYVLHVRAKAVKAALFPAMERIVQQEVLSPIKLDELLSKVSDAISAQPFSDTLEAFVHEMLQVVMIKRDTDARVKKGIQAVWGIL